MDQRGNREARYPDAFDREGARRYGNDDYSAERGQSAYEQEHRADRGPGYAPTRVGEYGQASYRQSDPRAGDYGRGGYWRDNEFRGDDRERASGANDWRGQGGYRGMSQQTMQEGWSGQGRGYGMQGSSGTLQPFYSYTEIWMIEGPHTGRGPRGFQRSDERIKEEVCERLTQHGQVDASDVEPDVRNGEVTLRGEVADRRTKRMAEEAIESIAGVRDVHNQLRVRQGPGQAARAGTDDAFVASRPGATGQLGGAGSAQGAVGTGNATSPGNDGDWQSQRAGFQQHFTSRQPTTSGTGERRTWEEAEPNYRFGYDAARAERYRGRRFDEAEPDLRRDYEERRRTSGRGDDRKWDELRDEVREGFERLRQS